MADTTTDTASPAKAAGILKTLLTSKKALVALVAAIVWGGGKLGLHLDNETMLGAVTPLWAYILGQGIADHGKEAAIINTEATNRVSAALEVTNAKAAAAIGVAP